MDGELIPPLHEMELPAPKSAGHCESSPSNDNSVS
jgi:hypothetical protein